MISNKQIPNLINMNDPFVDFLTKKLVKTGFFSREWVKDVVKQFNKKYADSNGGSPGEDNPVAQQSNYSPEDILRFVEDYYDRNSRNFNEDDYITITSVIDFLRDVIRLKALTTDKEQPKDGIWYKGKHLELSYVELYDLLHVYVLNSVGSLHSKCMNAFNTVIPTSKG